MDRIKIITTVPFDMNLLVIIFVVDQLLNIVIYPSTVLVLLHVH